MPDKQTAGEPVACRCGKCPALGLVDVDLSDNAHPRPRVGVTEAMVEVSAICMSDAWYEGEVAWTDLNENVKTTFRTMARDSLTAALALVDESAPGVKDRCPACTYFDEFDKMPAPWVVETDEWRVVDKDGTKVEGCDSLTEADHARTRHDVLYPKTAPHKVLQVYVREVLS